MKDPQELLGYIIEAIVNFPTEVKITKRVDEMGILLECKVHKNDMGVIIGRRGEHANAIKLLMKLCGFIHNLKISVKILEPDDQKK